MSLNYLYDILIHFHTYKNIDLINQGIYQIKSKIYTLIDNKKYYAIPYFYTESKDLENKYQTDEQEIKPHNVINSSVSENNYEYITKSFIIRYADEEVELDEFCYYRIEIPTSIPKNKIQFNCEFSLGFSDALSNLSKDIKNGNSLLQSMKFKVIQTQHVTISSGSNDNNLLEMYSPVVYHDSFSSLLNVSIHKLLIDYKMRFNASFMPFALEEVKEPIDGIKSPNNQNKYVNLSKNNTNAKDVSSLINFLLDEKEIKDVIPNNVIDDLYNKYVIGLIEAYWSIKIKMNRIATKLIDDSMKADYSTFLNNQPLIIYSEEKDQAVDVSNEDNLNEIIRKIKSLSRRIKDFSKDYVGFRIFQEINFISAQIGYLWHKYIELIRFFPGPVNFIMMMEFNNKLKEDLFKFLKKNIISITETSSLLLPIESNLQEHNNSQANEIRQNLIQNYLRPQIENENYKISPEIYPILFEETYMKNLNQNSDKQVILDTNSIYTNNQNNSNSVLNETSNLNQNSQMNLTNNNSDVKYENTLGLHLIVLVHGFQGNSNDMRLIKNEIALINPSCVFLSSVANQDDTEIDFVEMGKKLADEVKAYIKEWTEGLIFKKLSFIGHSIGGVIIRSALPHLEEFKNKFWMFISLSSPHLGYAFSESKIINAGMWVLKKWKGSKSLEQLMLTDKSNMKDTCVYKISEYEGLNWFNYVYLLSSHQDFYAPYESTRIQLSNKTLENDSKAETYRAMAYNILSKLTNNTLKRVDVNFVIQDKNLDSFIGRTAHIQFLENTDFMKIFFHNIEDLLK